MGLTIFPGGPENGERHPMGETLTARSWLRAEKDAVIVQSRRHFLGFSEGEAYSVTCSLLELLKQDINALCRGQQKCEMCVGLVSCRISLVIWVCLNIRNPILVDAFPFGLPFPPSFKRSFPPFAFLAI